MEDLPLINNERIYEYLEWHGNILLKYCMIFRYAYIAVLVTILGQGWFIFDSIADSVQS